MMKKLIMSIIILVFIISLFTVVTSASDSCTKYEKWVTWSDDNWKEEGWSEKGVAYDLTPFESVSASLTKRCVDWCEKKGCTGYMAGGENGVDLYEEGFFWKTKKWKGLCYCTEKVEEKPEVEKPKEEDHAKITDVAPEGSAVGENAQDLLGDQKQVESSEWGNFYPDCLEGCIDEYLDKRFGDDKSRKEVDGFLSDNYYRFAGRRIYEQGGFDSEISLELAKWREENPRAGEKAVKAKEQEIRKKLLASIDSGERKVVRWSLKEKIAYIKHLQNKAWPKSEYGVSIKDMWEYCKERKHNFCKQFPGSVENPEKRCKEICGSGNYDFYGNTCCCRNPVPCQGICEAAGYDFDLTLEVARLPNPKHEHAPRYVDSSLIKPEDLGKAKNKCSAKDEDSVSIGFISYKTPLGDTVACCCAKKKDKSPGIKKLAGYEDKQAFKSTIPASRDPFPEFPWFGTVGIAIAAILGLFVIKVKKG